MNESPNVAPITLAPTSIRVGGANGVGINVWDYGGEGTPLLLAHCTGTHGRMWDPVVQRLGPQFRVYAPDTRGHGDSDKPSDPAAYRWATSGEDLIAVLDALRLPTPVLAAGHSAGAAHICYASWKRPELFRRVVLIDPIVGPASLFSGPNRLAEKSRYRKNVLPSLDEARQRFASKPPMGYWHPESLEAYVRHGFVERPDGSVELKCPGQIEAAVYDGSGGTDVFEHLSELPLFVRLVSADGSDVRNLAELQKDRFRNVDFALLQGATHFIPQEKPDEIAALIADWLS